jgi:phytoene/squalene synthetase
VATTVHIPPRLLASAQHRADALGISRNRLIIRALERELGEAEAWSEEFLRGLRAVDPQTAKAAADLLAEVTRRRRSKRPPTL